MSEADERFTKFGKDIHKTIFEDGFVDLSKCSPKVLFNVSYSYIDEAIRILTNIKSNIISEIGSQVEDLQNEVDRLREENY
ncbi:MAG: hypothetical protein P1Q69_06935 [Candidatus Thorarchaeota archaeon]|nr:hypothetical protein [Candidatus Thorarchaeota archaeon]